LTADAAAFANYSLVSCVFEVSTATTCQSSLQSIPILPMPHNEMKVGGWMTTWLL
jgi:hypothetical protein